jgi:hypothetical protein
MELKEIDWGPMKQIMDSMAMQLGLISLTCAIAYFSVNLILRLINLPKAFSNFLATMAVLVVFYLLFKYDFIPGLVGKLGETV